jgi:hypothetical protein
VLAVVVADVECDGEYEFERRRFGSNPEQLQEMAFLSALSLVSIVESASC